MCNSCDRQQEKPVISDARQLRSIIRKAFDVIHLTPENAEVVSILRDGMKI